MAKHDADTNFATLAVDRVGGFRVTAHGKSLRVHLSGNLERAATVRFIYDINQRLAGGRYLVVLDGARLAHLDYRCVGMLVRWSRGLQSFGHRVLLDRWNEYLRAILAMEDWDGELERGTLETGLEKGPFQTTHIQVP